MLLDRFSAQTVDSGSISGHFSCFWPDLKIRSGPDLAWTPQPGLQIPELFSGPHSGAFMSAQTQTWHSWLRRVSGVDIIREISWKCDEKLAEKSSGMGPRKKFRNLQAWLGMTWLFCNLHSKPLTKYFPPLEAATAADLAQAFEPGLRRLRQQPT